MVENDPQPLFGGLFGATHVQVADPYAGELEYFVRSSEDLQLSQENQMTRLFYSALTIFIFSVSTISQGQTAERLALVIGNSAYQNVPELPNPARDSSDVGDALERLQFNVTRLQNATVAEIKNAVIELGNAANGAQMIVVFYAGHGIEANGENWLIPIDAKLSTEADAPNEAVSLRLVNAQVAKAAQLGLVILDACRDNPFAQSIQRSVTNPPAATENGDVPTRSVSKGLARAEPAANVLVAFAAKDGTVAGDGPGRNSPFTTALLANMEIQGLEVASLFRKVRDEVMRATKDTQQPFVYGSLSNTSIYFKPPEPELVKVFDGFWDAKLVCDPVNQLGFSVRFLGTIKNGVFAGQNGQVGKPDSATYEGVVDADGTIRITVTGLTGDPKITIGGATPRGSPYLWRAAGTLKSTSGTALRTSGRRCVFDFTKQSLGKPALSARGRR